MSRFGRLLLVVVLAMLPLRGMAAVAAGLCDAQAAASVQAHALHGCCEGAPTESGASHDCGGETMHGSCSHCAACTVGASAASPSTDALLPAPIGALAIPFLDRRVAGFVPELFDRPPLSF